MIASKTPAAFIRSASARVLVIDERSPGSAAAAPGTPANACCARASSRACRTTSWPPRASCLAASRPSPSAEPVISTLDIRRAPGRRLRALDDGHPDKGDDPDDEDDAAMLEAPSGAIAHLVDNCHRPRLACRRPVGDSSGYPPRSRPRRARGRVLLRVPVLRTEITQTAAEQLGLRADAK